MFKEFKVFFRCVRVGLAVGVKFQNLINDLKYIFGSSSFPGVTTSKFYLKIIRNDLLLFPFLPFLLKMSFSFNVKMLALFRNGYKIL